MHEDDFIKRTLDYFGVSDKNGYPCTVFSRKDFQQLAFVLCGTVDFRKKFRVTIDYDPEYENVLIRDEQADPASFQ